MGNKTIITKEHVRSAIKRLRRRKGYTKDSEISIKMIANEIGCSRNTLYREEFEEILAPFHRIKTSHKKTKPKKGSAEHFLNIIEGKDKTINKLKQDNDKAKDDLMDQEELKTCKTEIASLRKKVSEMYTPEQFERLASENAKLREILLRSGLNVQI